MSQCNRRCRKCLHNHAIKQKPIAPHWTVHLISDLCVDDVWSATDVNVFDRDDYLTTYGAPWVDVMRKLPRLQKLIVAPRRSVFLLLGCGHYEEGNGTIIGVSHFAPRGYAIEQAALFYNILAALRQKQSPNSMRPTHQQTQTMRGGQEKRCAYF